MTMRIFLFFSAVFLFWIPQKSFSGLHLEPYVGAGLVWNPSVSSAGFSGNETSAEETSSEKTKAWLTDSGAFSRLVAGGRIGWSKLGLAAGLDIGAGYYHNGIQVQSPKEWFYTVLPGFFVSYKLPILFRVYGALIPHGFLFRAGAENTCSSAEESDKCSSLPQNVKTNKPLVRSLKAGVSYISLPFLSLNIEYQPLYFSPGAGAPQEAKSEKGVLMHSIAAFLTVSL